MGTTDRSDVLRRKARSAREEHQARVMSPQKALRLAMARAADDLFEMALTVRMIQLDKVAQADALAAFRDDTLLMVLDGPEGAIGAASVDGAVLAGLIEMQTMGQVMSSGGDRRAPTQTDAALVAPLLDASLAGFTENLVGEVEAQWAEGVRFGARVETVRMLSLLVEVADFHLFRLHVALGENAREGEMVIALPVDVPVEPEGPCEDAQLCEGRLSLGQGAFLTAEAPLNAVLHRIRMPLAEVAMLKPGQRLLIPRAALKETRLEAGTDSAARKCRLGQFNGFRAVRLTLAPEAAGQSGEAERQTIEEDGQGHNLASAGELTGRSTRDVTGETPGRQGDSSGANGAQDAGGLAQEATALSVPEPLRAGDFGAVSGAQADVLPDLPDLGDLADLPELALGE